MWPTLRPSRPKDAQGLRVLTYNVLAQNLIRRDVYPTNGAALKWAVRHPALVAEVIAYDPDIVFLQEVDEVRLGAWDQCFDQLQMARWFFKGSNKSHGVVIAFRRAMFRHVAHKEPQYDAVGGPPRQTSTGGTAAAMVVEALDSGRRVVLATTHLYWHPDADYERLRQLYILLDAVAELRRAYGAAAVVLGGDLNSTPDSPVYQLLQTGGISAAVRDALRRSAATAHFGTLVPRADQMRPSLLADADAAVAEHCRLWEQLDAPHLTSCYAALSGEPPFTNWTDSFRETIDYILVSDDVKPVHVVPLPSAAELGPEPSSLPRRRGGSGYPSDHLSLIADVVLS